MRYVVSSVAGIALLAAAGAASAQTKWDFPTPYQDSNYHTQNARWFAEEVKKASGSAMELVVHSANSLIKLPEILKAVQSGQVPVGEILLSNFGNEDPMFEIDGVPFFAVGYDQSYKLYQAQKPFLEDRLAKRGIKLLYSVAWPGQGLYSKTPLNSLADYKGVKIRTYNPITQRLAELVGAVPTSVQASEVPQAFATNLVTAMITSSSTGRDTKAWEFAKIYYDTRAMHPRNAVIVNDRALQRLNEAQRKAILDTAAKAEARGWDLARAEMVSATKALADNGMQVLQPGEGIMKEYQAIGQKLIEEWAKKAGADGETLIANFRK